MPLSLITILGLDIDEKNEAEADKVRSLCNSLAVTTGAKCVSVATNLRSFDGYRAGNEYGEFSHAAALAGIGLLFQEQFKELIIASSYQYSQLHPWGSHPLLDPMYSSSRVFVNHDGTAFSRVEKTEAVFDRPDIARHVRVCYAKRGASNCCECPKCLRTMVTIDLLDKIESATSFDWNKYNLEKVAQVFLPDETNVYFFREILEAAERKNREDIARAVRKSMFRSRYLRVLNRQRGRLAQIPIAPHVWRFSKWILKRLLRT